MSSKTVYMLSSTIAEWLDVALDRRKEKISSCSTPPPGQIWKKWFFISMSARQKYSGASHVYFLLCSWSMECKRTTNSPTMQDWFSLAQYMESWSHTSTMKTRWSLALYPFNYPWVLSHHQVLSSLLLVACLSVWTHNHSCLHVHGSTSMARI